MRSLFVPQFRRGEMPRILGYAGLGAVIAGTYGALHDQVSYAICAQYFTHFKFEQFNLLEFEWPSRAKAALVGWQASWWVGAFGAWVLARVRVPREPRATIARDLQAAILIMILIAAGGGAMGLAYGSWRATSGNLGGWSDWRYMGVTDLHNFVRVGWLHNGSYLGAVAGLAGAVYWLIRRSSKR